MYAIHPDMARLLVPKLEEELAQMDATGQVRQ